MVWIKFPEMVVFHVRTPCPRRCPLTATDSGGRGTPLGSRARDDCPSDPKLLLALNGVEWVDSLSLECSVWFRQGGGVVQ